VPIRRNNWLMLFPFRSSPLTCAICFVARGNSPGTYFDPLHGIICISATEFVWTKKPRGL
jgi:hypothetical protein